MSSSSVSSAGSDALAGTVRVAQGPSPKHPDRECPICYRLIKTTDTAFEHIDCGCRFHDDCLQDWTAEPNGSTCPWCPEELPSPSDLEEVLNSDARKVRDSRRQRFAPTTYHAMADRLRMIELLKESASEFTDAEILTQVNKEFHQLDHMLDELEDAELGVDVFETGYILQKSQDFDLDQASMQYIWIESRLPGVVRWVLFQLASIPSISFWVPSGPSFDFDESKQAVIAYYSPEPQVPPSITIQVPLPTTFLLHYLEMRNSCLGEDDTADVFQRIRAFEEKKGTTFWFVCDDFRSEFGNRQLHISPWPRELVNDGFKTLAYPGHTQDSVQRECAWAAEDDKAHLDAFIAEHRLPTAEAEDSFEKPDLVVDFLEGEE
jgi:hypothetical protein